MDFFVKLKYIAQEIRVFHWIKNLPIFVVLLWLTHVDWSTVGLLFVGFLALNFTSSIVYICNDLKDIEHDKKHPTKKNRPLAAGKLSHQEAYALVFLFALVVLGLLSIMQSGPFDALLLGMLALNFMYTFWLKQVPYIDLLVLGALLAIRSIAGFILLGLLPPAGVALLFFTFSLFSMSIDRLAELELTGGTTRKALKYYSRSVLKILMTMAMMLTVIFYFTAFAFIALPIVYTDIIYLTILLAMNSYVCSAYEEPKVVDFGGFSALLIDARIVSLITLFFLVLLSVILLFR